MLSKFAKICCMSTASLLAILKKKVKYIYVNIIGVCFLDDEYMHVKAHFANTHIQIPSAVQSALHEQGTNIHFLITPCFSCKANSKLCKAFKIFAVCGKCRNYGKSMVPVCSSAHFNFFSDSWCSLFKLPQAIAKVQGKSAATWRANIFSSLYKFVLPDWDVHFEEGKTKT